MKRFINTEKWLDTIEAIRHEDDGGTGMEKTAWEESKEWWEPHVYVERDTGEKELSWLCDHLGDAQGVMEEMWEEILRLKAGWGK